jgi:hypothetical protein
MAGKTPPNELAEPAPIPTPAGGHSIPPQTANRDEAKSFVEAANAAAPSLVREFIEFLIDYKVWWVTPLVLVLLTLAGLVVLGGTAAAPFIYPLF